ncbi:MAG: hypothetical protein Q7R68_11155 [Nitrospirales bacterium]|nr:hypothetical protein [Nitrospirales bacterium]
MGTRFIVTSDDGEWTIYVHNSFKNWCGMLVWIFIAPFVKLKEVLCG